ncbi:RNA-binding protein 1-like isoform X3 [Anneissia japonica]|uniref:RNA-binding protein 1-like isoform X1 n=1 Tax=Anneissia japonica TaxID=1529436 RepID=UPI0014254EC7|nr:RNA-binding protein 1-like isoform X1 [Anneissia japonica]XP_033101289.1 RNA-binding protein 1-like isoform X2 [Anneissia japonica]XP_033101291.1 RNA-binding protein 1-like isoform X3 [Anneissia japonica]
MPSEARLYIGDLNPSATKSDVEREFGKYGHLRDIWLARNPPGFAFIEFEDSRDADEALRNLDGNLVLGTRIKVERSRGRSRGGRGGGGRGGRGGGFGGRGRDRDGRPGGRGRPSYGDYQSNYRRGYDDTRSSRYADSYSGFESRGPPSYRSRSPPRRRYYKLKSSICPLWSI